MCNRLQSQRKATSKPTPSFTAVRSRLPQHKWTLGGTPSPMGEYAESHGKPLVSQPPLLQAKLTIGKPGDTYEQEADRMGDLVMRMPEPHVQRQVEPEEEEEEEALQTKPLAGQITPLVQRQLGPAEEEEEEETLQTKPHAGPTPEVASDLHSRIKSLKGRGRPLPESARAFFEPRFGYDFSRVRIRTDTRATKTARAVSARSFTVGRDVMFGAGQYAPGTTAGKKLLAHELTHVVQQNANNRLHPDYSVKLRVHSKDDFVQCAYYTRKELTQYLNYLRTEGKIEDKSDSDDKAVAVVHWWEDRVRGFPLDKKVKSLLILEMLSGFTGNDEEQAILELLERSDNSELNYIFSSGGVTVKELESNFHGDEFAWLREFFDRRFEGGWEAALRGQLRPRGKPISKRWPLFAVFPERAEGEAGGESEIRLRKYIRTIDVRFASTRDISSLVWTFAEEETKKSFHGLKKREDFRFDIGTAKATYNDGTEDSFDVSGGAIGASKYKTHRTGPDKYVKVHRKGGVSYVNPKGDPMPHATFFYMGQAFHGCGSRDWYKELFAPLICLSVPSHGCIHVENSKIDKLYPFIIVGTTKVSIT